MLDCEENVATDAATYSLQNDQIIATMSCPAVGETPNFGDGYTYFDNGELRIFPSQDSSMEEVWTLQP